MITVDNKRNAWKLVYRLTGHTIYCKEDEASENADYDIYRNEEKDIYVRDLGARLEINYADGTIENIWIDELTPKAELPETKYKNLKEKLIAKVCELIDKEEFDNIYKLLELISDYKDVIE